MEKLRIADIVRCTGGTLLKGDETQELSDVGTDSRVMKQGMLFVALVGDRFDGNDYAKAAVEAGAVGCVVSRPVDADGCVILVDDTLKALGKIAAYYRHLFRIPFVGITGSVGKTTTKDMIACALQAKYNVLKTHGNFNNQIGLPLTLFRLTRDHEIGVTEMGMSGFGEIDALAAMVKPDTAVYTNIGLSHIEKLGSRENILKAKMEMLNHVPKKGFVVLCGDDDMLWSLRGSISCRHVYYGIENEGCEVKASQIRSDGTSTTFLVSDGEHQMEMEIPVLGEHNVKNALAAYLVARHYGVGVQMIAAALKMFTPGKMRQNIVQVGGVTIINDCYNASPTSVEAGLKILNQLCSEGRKTAILGDMLEMGDWAKDAHQLVGKYVMENKVDFLITVGENSKNIAKGAVDAGFSPDAIRSFVSNQDVIGFLDGFLKSKDTVLVKGSRGMKLEEIVDHIVGF